MATELAAHSMEKTPIAVFLVALAFGLTSAQIHLDGTVRRASGIPAAGVSVALAVAQNSTTTDSSGRWEMEQGTGICQKLSLARNASRLQLEGRRLLVDGHDISGRMQAPARGDSASKRGMAPRSQAVADTLLFSWKGSIRIRLPVASYSQTGIVTVLPSDTAAGTHNGRMVYTPTGLWADTTEVTRSAYEAVTGLKPSYFALVNTSPCPRCPVENITAQEAMLYANALTRKEMSPDDTVYAYTGITWTVPVKGSTAAYTKTKEAQGLTQLTIRPGAKGYRLPTEAEWKRLAAAGGAQNNVYWYSYYKSPYEAFDSSGLYAWYKNNAAGMPKAVAQKIPNKYGLYDLMGNVEEYTSTPDGNDYVSKGVAADATQGSLNMMMAAQAQWLTGMRLVREARD